MGSNETATATTGGPRVIAYLTGMGCHRDQIISFFCMQIGPRTPSGIGLGSGSRRDRMRPCSGLSGELWIQNLGGSYGTGPQSASGNARARNFLGGGPADQNNNKYFWVVLFLCLILTLEDIDCETTAIKGACVRNLCFEGNGDTDRRFACATALQQQKVLLYISHGFCRTRGPGPRGLAWKE